MYADVNARGARAPLGEQLGFPPEWVRLVHGGTPLKDDERLAGWPDAAIEVAIMPVFVFLAPQLHPQRFPVHCEADATVGKMMETIARRNEAEEPADVALIWRGRVLRPQWRLVPLGIAKEEIVVHIANRTRFPLITVSEDSLL
jgi:hypothetical protein